jgi:endonuclease/exonuclease/phosphatase family metal-dependent hydrolase
MKRTVALLIAAMLMQLALNAQDLKVISYNIRNSAANDGTNSWIYRYAATGEMLKDQQADIFGLQEALHDQIYFLEQNFKDYKRFGSGRDDGKKKGEYTAIFWNKKTLSFIDGGMFWLSETPEKASKGWDAECTRTATWVIFKDKETGKKFYCVNTHLDHVGKEARRNGLRLIMDRIAQMNKAGLPLILMGDFNMKPGDASLADVEAEMVNARKAAQKTDGAGTFNNWGKTSEIIDYIFYTGFSACPEYQTVTKRYAERKFVSDHFPIMVQLNF